MLLEVVYLIENSEKNFCENMKALRHAHRLSKRAMAKRLEIGGGSLTTIEKGTIPPRLSCDILLRVYREFGILPSELISPDREKMERPKTEKEPPTHKQPLSTNPNPFKGF